MTDNQNSDGIKRKKLMLNDRECVEKIPNGI